MTPEQKKEQYEKLEGLSKTVGLYVSKSQLDLCKEENCYEDRQNGSSRCGGHKQV